jgi:hypothetical protein
VLHACTGETNSPYETSTISPSVSLVADTFVSFTKGRTGDESTRRASPNEEFVQQQSASYRAVCEPATCRYAKLSRGEKRLWRVAPVCSAAIHDVKAPLSLSTS